MLVTAASSNDAANFLYVAHMGDSGVATSIVDVRDTEHPEVVGQLLCPPGVHSHKVQIAGDLLLVNYESHRRRASGNGADGVDPDRLGFALYDISNPTAPHEVGFFVTGGKGVHRAWFAGGRYAYVSARPAGFRERMLIIVDVSDPVRPVEAGRWWVPTSWEAGGEDPPHDPDERFGIHHPIVHGDRAYLAMLDAGVAILDVADPRTPTVVAWVQWPHGEGHNHHTALPLPSRGLLVVADECDPKQTRGFPWHVHLLDISDENHPHVTARFPVPDGDYAKRPLWFSPHNLHENRPGSLVDERLIYVTYFNAGLRVFDTQDPSAPREVAYFVPPPPDGQPASQLNDVYVDEAGLIYVTDRRAGGVYILEWIDRP